MDCLQSINVEKVDWLSPTACTDNLQKLIDNEKKALTEDEELEENIVLQSLNLLSRLYKMLDFISTKQIQLVWNIWNFIIIIFSNDSAIKSNADH